MRFQHLASYSPGHGIVLIYFYLFILFSGAAFISCCCCSSSALRTLFIRLPAPFGRCHRAPRASFNFRLSHIVPPAAMKNMHGLREYEKRHVKKSSQNGKRNEIGTGEAIKDKREKQKDLARTHEPVEWVGCWKAKRHLKQLRQCTQFNGPWIMWPINIYESNGDENSKWGRKRGRVNYSCLGHGDGCTDNSQLIVM